MIKLSQILKEHIFACITAVINTSFKSLLPEDSAANAKILDRCKCAIANNWEARMCFQKAVLAKQEDPTVVSDRATSARDKLVIANKEYFNQYVRPTIVDHDVFVVAVVDTKGPIIVTNIFYDGNSYGSLSAMTVEGEVVREVITWLPMEYIK
jgi:hypothetical protein